MNTRRAAVAAVPLALALVLGGCAVIDTASTGMPGMNHGGGPGSASTVEANNTDLMFTMMMIPHHQQAVDMVDALLAKEGIDESVRALAEQISAAQQPEIAQMEEWLDEWDAGMSGSSQMPHGGMMSDADMAALDAATGADAVRLFLMQMIEHHRGAIEMAQDEIDDGRDPEVIGLARTIVATQTAEIATMEDMLAAL